MSHHPFVTIDGVSLSIAGKHILSDINVSLEAGSVTSLLGPSGCGKTSLLRLIAGLTTPSQGTITIGQQLASSPERATPPEQRGIGMVFQDYALFPHLSVLDNITFGLKNYTTQQKRQRAHELLEMVGLEGYEQRSPHQLSGGEQQRVAIARAIAPQPQLLLLDEPFASLDTNLRERLVREIGALLQSLNIATILVTHDQHEAFAVSDFVGMMHNGRIVQWDTPNNVYYQPSNEFVAQFVGQGAFLSATVMAGGVLRTSLGDIISDEELSYSDGDCVKVFIRPHDIVEDFRSSQSAYIERTFFRGSTTLYELQSNDQSIMAQLDSVSHYKRGDSINISLRPKKLIVFPADATELPC